MYRWDNFSSGGSCVFDSHSTESVASTLYEDSCETDSNESTIYNKSRSELYSMFRLDKLDLPSNMLV